MPLKVITPHLHLNHLITTFQPVYPKLIITAINDFHQNLQPLPTPKLNFLISVLHRLDMHNHKGPNQPPNQRLPHPHPHTVRPAPRPNARPTIILPHPNISNQRPVNLPRTTSNQLQSSLYFRPNPHHHAPKSILLPARHHATSHHASATHRGQVNHTDVINLASFEDESTLLSAISNDPQDHIEKHNYDPFLTQHWQPDQHHRQSHHQHRRTAYRSNDSNNPPNLIPQHHQQQSSTSNSHRPTHIRQSPHENRQRSNTDQAIIRNLRQRQSQNHQNRVLSQSQGASSQNHNDEVHIVDARTDHRDQNSNRFQPNPQAKGVLSKPQTNYQQYSDSYFPLSQLVDNFDPTTPMKQAKPRIPDIQTQFDPFDNDSSSQDHHHRNHQLSQHSNQLSHNQNNLDNLNNAHDNPPRRGNEDVIEIDMSRALDSISSPICRQNFTPHADSRDFQHNAGLITQLGHSNVLTSQFDHQYRKSANNRLDKKKKKVIFDVVGDTLDTPSVSTPKKCTPKTQRNTVSTPELHGFMKKQLRKSGLGLSLGNDIGNGEGGRLSRQQQQPQEQQHGSKGLKSTSPAAANQNSNQQLLQDQDRYQQREGYQQTKGVGYASSNLGPNGDEIGLTGDVELDLMLGLSKQATRREQQDQLAQQAKLLAKAKKKDKKSNSIDKTSDDVLIERLFNIIGVKDAQLVDAGHSMALLQQKVKLFEKEKQDAIRKVTQFQEKYKHHKAIFDESSRYHERLYQYAMDLRHFVANLANHGDSLRGFTTTQDHNSYQTTIPNQSRITNAASNSTQPSVQSDQSGVVVLKSVWDSVDCDIMVCMGQLQAQIAQLAGQTDQSTTSTTTAIEQSTPQSPLHLQQIQDIQHKVRLIQSQLGTFGAMMTAVAASNQSQTATQQKQPSVSSTALISSTPSPMITNVASSTSNVIHHHHHHHHQQQQQQQQQPTSSSLHSLSPPSAPCPTRIILSTLFSSLQDFLLSTLIPFFRPTQTSPHIKRSFLLILDPEFPLISHCFTNGDQLSESQSDPSTSSPLLLLDIFFEVLLSLDSFFNRYDEFVSSFLQNQHGQEGTEATSPSEEVRSEVWQLLCTNPTNPQVLSFFAYCDEDSSNPDDGERMLQLLNFLTNLDGFDIKSIESLRFTDAPYARANPPDIVVGDMTDDIPPHTPSNQVPTANDNKSNNHTEAGLASDNHRDEGSAINIQVELTSIGVCESTNAEIDTAQAQHRPTSVTDMSGQDSNQHRSQQQQQSSPPLEYVENDDPQTTDFLQTPQTPHQQHTHQDILSSLHFFSPEFISCLFQRIDWFSLQPGVLSLLTDEQQLRFAEHVNFEALFGSDSTLHSNTDSELSYDGYEDCSIRNEEMLFTIYNHFIAQLFETFANSTNFNALHHIFPKCIKNNPQPLDVDQNCNDYLTHDQSHHNKPLDKKHQHNELSLTTPPTNPPDQSLSTPNKCSIASHRLCDDGTDKTNQNHPNQCLCDFNHCSSFSSPGTSLTPFYEYFLQNFHNFDNDLEQLEQYQRFQLETSLRAPTNNSLTTETNPTNNHNNQQSNLSHQSQANQTNQTISNLLNFLPPFPTLQPSLSRSIGSLPSNNLSFHSSFNPTANQMNLPSRSFPTPLSQLAVGDLDTHHASGINAQESPRTAFVPTISLNKHWRENLAHQLDQHDQDELNLKSWKKGGIKPVLLKSRTTGVCEVVQEHGIDKDNKQHQTNGSLSANAADGEEHYWDVHLATKHGGKMKKVLKNTHKPVMTIESRYIQNQSDLEKFQQYTNAYVGEIVNQEEGFIKRGDKARTADGTATPSPVQDSANHDYVILDDSMNMTDDSSNRNVATDNVQTAPTLLQTRHQSVSLLSSLELSPINSQALQHHDGLQLQLMQDQLEQQPQSQHPQPDSQLDRNTHNNQDSPQSQTQLPTQGPAQTTGVIATDSTPFTKQPQKRSRTGALLSPPTDPIDENESDNHDHVQSQQSDQVNGSEHPMSRSPTTTVNRSNTVHQSSSIAHKPSFVTTTTTTTTATKTNSVQILSSQSTQSHSLHSQISKTSHPTHTTPNAHNNLNMSQELVIPDENQNNNLITDSFLGCESRHSEEDDSCDDQRAAKKQRTVPVHIPNSLDFAESDGEYDSPLLQTSSPAHNNRHRRSNSTKANDAKATSQNTSALNQSESDIDSNHAIDQAESDHDRSLAQIQTQSQIDQNGLVELNNQSDGDQSDDCDEAIESLFRHQNQQHYKTAVSNQSNSVTSSSEEQLFITTDRSSVPISNAALAFHLAKRDILGDSSSAPNNVFLHPSLDVLPDLEISASFGVQPDSRSAFPHKFDSQSRQSSIGEDTSHLTSNEIRIVEQGHSRQELQHCTNINPFRSAILPQPSQHLIDVSQGHSQQPLTNRQKVDHNQSLSSLFSSSDDDTNCSTQRNTQFAQKQPKHVTTARKAACKQNNHPPPLTELNSQGSSLFDDDVVIAFENHVTTTQQHANFKQKSAKHVTTTPVHSNHQLAPGTHHPHSQRQHQSTQTHRRLPNSGAILSQKKTPLNHRHNVNLANDDDGDQILILDSDED